MTRRRSESLTLSGLGVRVAALTALAVLLSMTLAPAPASAQFQEYTPPGSTADRPGDDRERLEKEMAEALWKVGAFRLNPWIGITNASLVSNAFTTSSDQPQDTDFTLTLGAGLTGIVPFGQKVFVTLEAIPQYVFWLDQGDRNSFNQQFGARLHGFYNSLYLELGARRHDQVQVRSSEFDQATNTRRDITDAVAELRIGGSFHVFGGASFAEITTLEDEIDQRLSFFSSQDREETVLRGGIRYRPREKVLIGAGIENSEADFLDTARDRSNTGTSPFVEISYDAPKFFVTADIVLRDHEPEGETSEFVALNEATGSVQLTMNPGWRMTYSPYLKRDLSYAITEDYSYYLRDRFGLRVSGVISERWRGSVFGETGEDDFVGVLPTAPARVDDVTSWGVDFSVDLSARFALNCGYTLTDYTSDFEGANRDNGRITISLASSGLRVGRQ